MTLRHHTSIPAVIIVALVMMACAKAPPQAAPPQPVNARVTITAAADSNPDGTGRPSPVVVRVFQLRDDEAFNGADFFALYEDEKKVLGLDLLERHERQMGPSEQQTVNIVVNEDAQALGAIAAYRDLRNAVWRVTLPLPLPPKAETVTLTVERARVAFSVPQPATRTGP